MRLLLDTHIWVRWLSGDQPLGVGVTDIIEQADYLAVSANCMLATYDETIPKYDIMQNLIVC